MVQVLLLKEYHPKSVSQYLYGTLVTFFKPKDVFNEAQQFAKIF